MEKRNSYLVPIIILGVLFFIFGFVTWLNGTLIPYLKIACEIKTEFQSFLVVAAFFIAYTVMALPAAFVLKKTGYKKGMSLGLMIMAVGALIFIPAAKARDYNLFLLGLFIIGSGLALLQTASNPYATIIGPIESAAKRISIMGICNKVGGILAGLIFGYIALNDADILIEKIKFMDETAKATILQELANRVIVPYGIIAAAFVALAIGVLFSGLPDIKETEEVKDLNSPVVENKTSVFQFPYLVLGVIALFLYVGVEVLAGDSIINYGKSIGIQLSTARYFTQAFLGCMLAGYIIGIVAIPKYLSQAKALKLSAISGIVFTILAIFTNGFVSVAFIALLGLANALVWPAIWPLAIDGLGKFIKTGSALLIMAIAGGAIIPLLYAKLVDIPSIGNKQAYWIMVPCYLFILFYSMRGYKMKKW